MHPRRQLSPALLRLAAAQADVVSREQALGHGLTQNVLTRLVTTGQWRRLAQGVYLTVPVPTTWDALAWAGILLGGDQARLGPEASGHLHGLLPGAPEPVDVLVPYGRPVRVAGPWTFTRERLAVRSSRCTGSPARLSIDATVVDLAAHRDAGEVVGLVTTAVQTRRTTPERLRRELGSRSAHPHRKLLIDLLGDVEAGAQSPLEIRYLRDVERPHGLPQGERQVSQTGLAYLSDVRYRAWGLLVELDGRDGHVGVGRFRDMYRDNAFVVATLLTLRYGWYDVVHRPCAAAWQVGAVLCKLGWPELPTRCRRCAHTPDADLASIA